jgi:predicted Holliday junction resolvase-like endonuclease
MLVIFFFVVFAFAVVALRTEKQSNQLREIVQNEKVKNYQECVERNLNVDKLNRISDRIIEAEKHNPFIDDRLRQVRIDIYKDQKLVRADCGVNPSPGP